MYATRVGLASLLLLTVAACSSDAPDAESAAAEEAAAPEVTLSCVTSADAAALAERPSPLDSVSFTLSSGPAKLCYSRPSTRGRVMVGEVDPFDQPWRMGANEPTTLHLAGPATIGDVAVDAGAYAIYAIPTESGPWTVVVNGNPDRWGVPITEEVRAADVGSFEVEVMALDEAAETLSFSFESGADGGALIFAFESRTFRIPVAGS